MPLVVVTGAGGFVGTALCSQLVQSGWQLRAALRQPPRGSEHQPEVRVVGEIGSHTDWAPVLQGATAVVHLAARVHVMRDSGRDAFARYREANADATEQLARAAAAAGVQRFVYLSSIKVNGEATSERPFTEADSPAPADAYALSKWEAEQALARVRRESGLEVVVLRPPLVYGPGVKANFLSLVDAVARGWPLPLAAVRNQRSLVYVGNLVSAIVRCLEHPAAAGRTYLVADGESVSTGELIRGIARALERPARLFPAPTGLLRLAAP
jgi:nucleoside-diphosphate-sugar epimerase